MDRRRAAGVLLALAACVAYATAAPTASNHTSLDVYDGAPDGCYYNFQHYGEGDRIMTNEPCLNCTCHNRMLMCYLRVCPFTKPIGQDCTIEKRADQCCPIVTCPDVPVDLLTSTTTSPAEYGATGLGKLDKYGCSIHGKYFPEGSKVPPTPNKPCEHCYCIRNMTTCVMQECTLHVDGCTPIYHKDVCCPVRYSCDHPEDEMPLLDDLSTTVRPTPGFLLTTTPISPVTQMSQDCLYENQVIRDGALIKTEKACDHCYCMKGDIVCVVQECGTPMENEGKNCTALAPREGVCCPDTYICEGDEPTTGTYEMDYTTELEKLATLTPPRRSESEGSGYRKETDDVPDTEILPTETETEGSGYDQATIFPTVLTETPDSHKIESSDELMPSTTIKQLDSHDVTTESELQKDIESHDISSTTSTYISQPIFESLSTKAQDEDIGSGEEDIISPFTEAPSAPTAADHEPTVSSEQNAFTLDDSQVTDSETHVQGTTAGTLTGDENQTEVPKEPSVSSYDNTMDITTHDALGGDEEVETSTFDDEYKFTENDNLRTTAIPAVEENEKETTSSSQAQDKETSDAHHYVTPPTNVPGIEDNLSTTELQETATDSFEETVSEIYDHHPLTATSSTPLLEEIEKDTMDQEAIRDESTSDAGKISTIGLNVPTEESIDKDNLIPDLIDETIATNIPTTVSTIDEDSVTTEDEHTNKESDYEYSSEPQQHSSTTITSISRDGTESTSSIDPITTSKAQETEASESFDHPHDISATVPDVDKTKETTSSDDVTTSKFDEDLETNAEHTSEPQYSPTTSGPRYDGESKETTQIPITVVKESSESQESDSTTSAAILDDETKLSSSDKTQEGQDNVEDSSESQHYEPTTIKPLVDVQTIETTSIKPMDDDLIKDVSESQENVPTTNASMLEDETKVSTPIVSDSDNMESSKSTIAPVFEVEDSKPTPSDGLTTSEAQDVQKADTDDSSESNENVPVTSVPAFEDDLKKTTLSDYVSTSKDQKSDVVDSSESNQYAPTTIGIVSEDESKLTTQSDLTTASNIQDMEKTQEYIPTTSASSLKDESKYTTSLGFEKSSTPVASEFEDKTEETISITTAKQNEITTIEPDKGLNTIPSGSIEEEITESPEVEQSHAVEVVPAETDTDAGKLHDVTESAVDTADLSTQDSSTSSNDLLPKSTESAVKEIDDSSTKVYDVTENIIRVTDLTNEEISTLTYNQESSTKHPVTEYLDRSTSTLSSNTESDTEKPIDTSYEHSPEITSSQSSEESQPATSSPYSDSVTVSTASDMKENEISNESRIPGEGDCLLNGITYRNESAVPSTNKCQSGCRCSSSIIKCDPIICSPPPEYMDNCQTTYDSPDSCCPTFVCDHKTETMPPQSHSQMSGTEAPVESPIKCIGDECILTEHKKEPSTTSNCDSDNCSVQDTQIANVPAEDQNKECSGSLCKTGANECSLENGCEATPVKPCEGLECDDSSQTILPPKQEPCSGDNCDDENELNIEKECTDKSCKRKDNSELDEKPPKKCLGSECPLIDTSPVETEKIEDSSKASSTETNIDINHEVEEHVTEADLELKTTIAISDESTKLSEQGTKKDEISTSYELTTPSHKESFEPELTTKDYESQHDYSTDKVVYDVTSEAAELQTNIPDLSVDDKSTVADAADVTTTSPKTYTDQEQDNFTKVPLESDGKDVTTLSQEQQTTQVTQLPEKYVPEDVSETTSIIQEVENDAMSTLAPGSSDTISYDGTTKFSVDTNEEDTDSTDNVTKSPHISEESTTKYSEAVDTTSKLDDTDLQDSITTEDSTTKIADVIDSKTTTPKLTDLQETTEVTNDSYNEETSLKSTDVFESQSDVSTTTVSSRSSTEIIAETSKFDDLEKTHDITVTTQPEATTISTIEDEKTEASKSSEADVSVVTESLEETYSEETTTEQEIKSPTSKPYDVQSQETTMPSEKTEDLEITKIPSVTEPSSVSTTDTITKSPVTVEFTISDGSSPTFETEPSKVAVTDSSGLEITSTTKPLVTDSETQYTTADTDMEPNKSDETVTHLTEPISTLEPSLDVATIQSLDDDHKLYTESNIQENTTPEQSILSELTTQTVLVPDSNIIETEGPDDDKEIITRIQDQTESITESATESIDRTTSSSVESSPVKEDDLTSILPHQVTTESPLDFTISSESHSEVTASSDKPSEFDETTPTKINNIPQTVTELPIEEEPEKETMKTIIKDVTDEAQTQVSELEKTEKDTTTEQAIYEPSETTDNIDKKPEQIQPIDTHEEQPAEPSRVAAIPDVFATKQPDDSEIEKETQTEKPGVQENDLNSETTLSNEITDTYDEKITESPMKEEEKQETTQYHEIKPTESLTEMYTETPLAVSSDREDQTIDDEKLTTVSVKIPEPTTESADLLTNAPSEPSPLNEDLEITPKEPVDTKVTLQEETTSETEKLQGEEIQTTVSDLPIEQESTTKEQQSNDIPKLTTESPKYTDYSEESTTTEKHLSSETVTEVVGTTKVVDETTSEKEYEPSASATTASEEQITEKQGDSDTVTTEKILTTDFMISETTKLSSAFETSTHITTGPVEEAITTMTSLHELSESTTSKVDDEVVHAQKESTESPTTVEPMLAPTATKQDEVENLIPSKTERPEIYATTLSETEEPIKSTPSIREGGSTGSDQSDTSESDSSDDNRLTTNPAFDVETHSTIKTPAIEDETEKAITPSESSIQPEPSSVATVLEDEKPTTEVEKQTTTKVEPTTAYPVFDKFTKTTQKPTDAPATEQPKPIPTEEQVPDDALPTDEEPPLSGPSGYGTDPDYMEEDQTFGPGTCRYGGKVYVSAQQIPRDDPCDFCFCFRSDIICLQQSCPPPIHGCHEEPISGFCCPRYECPVSMATTVNVTTTTTTTTTTLPPHFPVHSYKGSAQKRGCLIKGHTYKVGEVVRASSGPCLHCTCGGDGQMKCDPKQCTPEPMLRQMIAAAVSAKRRR